MKTPKRKGTSTPPDSVKDCEQRTRWKRKNREAQLKRTITRLTKQVSHLKNLITIKNERIRAAWQRNKTFIFKIIDRDAFIENSGTYGHDIEGS